MKTTVDDMTETQLREAIRSYEESAAKGELTSREATRLRELKAALRNIRGAKINRW